MTIDSSWLSAFKEDLPHAFTPQSAFRASAVFVDGQIKLMQATQSEPQTWDDFIYRQFVRHLQKWFESCDAVVLAFDNYEHVPRAKCMTQVPPSRARPRSPPSLNRLSCRQNAGGTCPCCPSPRRPSCRAWSPTASAGPSASRTGCSRRA